MNFFSLCKIFRKICDFLRENLFFFRKTPENSPRICEFFVQRPLFYVLENTCALCLWFLILASKGLSSESQSLALPLDLFCIFGLGLEPFVLDSTSANKFSQKTASNRKDSGRFKVKCFCCGNTNHVAHECRFKGATQILVKLQVAVEKVCRKKAQQCTTSLGKTIDVQEVNFIANKVTSFPLLEVVIATNDTKVTVKIDTATASNFLS